MVRARLAMLHTSGASLGSLSISPTPGAPIAQALVEVDGLTSPTTGPDGRFRVSDLPPGPHRITAWERQHAFADKQVTLTVGKELDLDTLSIRREGQARMFTLIRAR
jgi:hypothetical protein